MKLKLLMRGLWKEPAKSKILDGHATATAAAAILERKAGPIDRLGRIFNQPVLTERESRKLLSEINSTFRIAANRSHLQDDVINPPATLYKTLAQMPATHSHEKQNLRSLLSSHQLVDNSSLGVFQKHIAEGTITEAITIECLKKHITLQLNEPEKSRVYRNHGLTMWYMLKASKYPTPDALPGPPLRSWLVAALMLSTKPSILFKWLVSYMSYRKRSDAGALLREILISHKKIYGSADETVAFFVHLLRLHDAEYVGNTALHPRGDLVKILGRYRGLSADIAAIRWLDQQNHSILVGATRMLSGWASPEGRELLAANMKAWDVPVRDLSAQLLLELRDPVPNVKHSHGLAGVSSDHTNWGTIQYALRVIQRLVVTNQPHTLVDTTAKALLEKLLPLKAENGSEDKGHLAKGNIHRLVKTLLDDSDEGRLSLVSGEAWAKQVDGLHPERMVASTG
ncbi:hypothetical protein DRE_02814 [Drechslerella stenobrocha 248]|uniref:Uncharacterized protein n=1 Tax=Drechslerella stenobrocha 248 TaxID=1043628 RepID=W7I631_9PEZI|nr:hypothetical protein DRE_02814 [Drechslerella stenobrocha 248]